MSPPVGTRWFRDSGGIRPVSLMPLSRRYLSFAEREEIAVRSFATEAVATARAAGCTGTLLVRADSAFYSAAFTSAVRRAGAFFSVTVQMNPHVRAAIAGIGEDACRDR